MSHASPQLPLDPKTSREENERQYRVLNQMLSAHSLLRDRYERRSLYLKVGLFCSSIVLAGFAFADENLFGTIGLKPQSVKLLVGFTSLGVTAISVVELLVGWEGKAARHDEAVRRLATLKHRFRKTHTKYDGANVRANETLSRQWERLSKSLTPIPESQFVKLKHIHYRKHHLSKLAETNRQVPYFFLIIAYYGSGIRDMFRNGLSGDQTDSSQKIGPDSTT